MSRIWDAMKQAERERELYVVPVDGLERPLSARQRSAIAAIVECPTLAEASRRCKVAERTLGRWLSEPGFTAAYRRASFARCGEAIAALQAASADAVRVLRQELSSASAAVRVRAAISILDLAIRSEIGQQPAARTARPKRTKRAG
jgi:hypothetical protein